MELAADILSWLLILAGSALCILGAAGLIRLNDVYTRMHSASLIDTLGVGFIILGLAFQAGFTLVLAKLGMIVVFILFTSPTGTHALCRAALAAGIQPKTVDGSRATIDIEPDEDRGEEAEPSKT